MKKISFGLVLIFLLVTMQFVVLANTSIDVAINGKRVDFEVQPTIINGSTMVPLRAIFEALGASVEWDDATKTVTSTKNNTTIKMTIGSKMMSVNGSEVELNESAIIIDGFTLVPVRAISEAFGCQVDWHNNTHLVGEKAIVDHLVSIVTDENVMYQAFVDFIKANGTYEDGKYSIIKEYESIDSQDGTITAGVLKYAYNTSDKFLFVEYTEGLFYSTDRYSVRDILVPIDKKKTTYDWIYTEQTSVPFFMQGYGTVKATKNRFHADSDVISVGVLKGRESYSGHLKSFAKVSFNMFDLISEDIFIESGSLLRWEYFGV